MNHTDQCVSAKARWQRAKEKFEESHPAFCRKCGGTGQVGSGTIDRDTGFPDVESCSCVEEGRCPLCASALTVDCVCEECGWGTPGSAPEFLIDPPECFCWEIPFEEAVSTSRNFRDFLEEVRHG